MKGKGMPQTANDTSDNCLNCESPVSGNFCDQCGQSATVGRITFGETFNHFLSSAFSFEGPFLNTIRLLFINPGKVYREFLAGRRKSYYKPVAFFVLLTALYIIVRKLIGFDPLQGQMNDVNEEGLPEHIKKTKEAARFMVNNINNIMFFLVLSIGLMLKLFFRKQYNLAEYTSVGFFITAIYILLGIPVMLIGKYAGLYANQYQLLILITVIFYSSLSFFQRYNFWSILKYLFVSIFSLLLYIISGFGFAYLVVLWR